MAMSGQGTKDEEQVALLVNRLGRAVQCLQYAYGLNPAQWEALRYLSQANLHSRRPSALAAFLGTTKGTASQTLKALEAKGYIRRTRLGSDRRGVRLTLTEAGQAVLEDDPLQQIDVAWQGVSDETEGLGAALRVLVRELQLGCGLKEFGVCEECRHLRDDDGAAAAAHRCGLTGEPLPALEVGKICVDFEPRAG